MRVLSLFDGLGGARLALDQLGIECEYLASEIDPHAIKVAQKNYPDIQQLGNISFLEPAEIGAVDLLIGGSACQSLSAASRTSGSGLEQGESKIFWEYVRLWQALKPEWWLFENVASMPAADRDTISQIFGRRPWVIDSALVSAQQRSRCYWTNLPIQKRPDNRGILFEYILESGYTERKKALCLPARYGSGIHPRDYLYYKIRQYVWLEPPKIHKTKTHRVITVGNDTYQLSKGRPSSKQMQAELGDIKKYLRKLTPTECESLQMVPKGYTAHVSDTQRYKLLGNSFTIGVIKHFLKELLNV